MWPNAGHGVLIYEVSRSHSDISQTAGLLWISSSQRPLPDNTQHSLQTDMHAHGGIRTYNLSRQAAAELRLRPHGLWDRHCGTYGDITPFERTYHWVRFSATVQTGPEAHPASCTMSTRSFPGVKRPVLGVDYQPHLAPRLQKEQSYTSTLPLGLLRLA